MLRATVHAVRPRFVPISKRISRHDLTNRREDLAIWIIDVSLEDRIVYPRELAKLEVLDLRRGEPFRH